MVCASFRDCITLCQSMPNIFRLNFEGSSNGSEGHLFLEFIQCKGMTREDLLRAKVRIDKILVESSLAGFSLAETFSDDSGKSNGKKNCRSWGIESSHVG
jgi:hypothetical protein